MISKSAPEIQIECYAQTDVGIVRKGNEDNYLILDLTTRDHWLAGSRLPSSLLLKPARYGSLLAVADGLGGALAGEVASEMTVNNIRELMLRLETTTAFAELPFSERLRLAIEQVNRLINDASNREVSYTGMGSTITAAGIDRDQAYLAQVGDSRCYLIRHGAITRVTKDQSVVEQLIDAGYITEAEAESHQLKNVILQALGVNPRVNVVVERLPLQRHDILLLCSDGLSGKINSEEMLEVVAMADDLKTAVERLILLANQRGGEDNITVLIARFDGAGLPATIDDPAGGNGPIVKELIARDEMLPDEIDLQQLDKLTPEISVGMIDREEDVKTLEPIELKPVGSEFGRGVAAELAEAGHSELAALRATGSDGRPARISWWSRIFTIFSKLKRGILNQTAQIILKI